MKKLEIFFVVWYSIVNNVVFKVGNHYETGCSKGCRQSPVLFQTEYLARQMYAYRCLLEHNISPIVIVT